MDYSAEIRRLKNLQQPECLTGEEADGILEGSYFSCQSAGRDLSLISGANSENQSLVGDIDSAIDILIKEYKVDSKRLKAVGYGETKPIASNKTKKGRAENRRIMAVVDKETQVAK